MLQESVCTPIGRQCYETINKKNIECLTPCEGIFADMEMSRISKPIEDIEKMKKVLEEYTNYKYGNSDNWDKIPGNRAEQLKWGSDSTVQDSIVIFLFWVNGLSASLMRKGLVQGKNAAVGFWL